MKKGGTNIGRYAQVWGSPGEKPRLMGFIRSVWPLMLVLAAGGYLIRAAWPVPALGRTGIGFLLLLLCGVLACSTAWSEKRLAHFLKGARGEEQVARRLSLLPAAYHVFHGVSMGKGMFSGWGDCDHVVVGPTGVFVIETKNWSSAITIQDGEIYYDDHSPRRSPLDQVKQAASTLRSRLAEEQDLQVEIQPLLCFAGGKLKKESTGVSGVVVCIPETVLDVLQDSVETPLTEEVRKKVFGWLEKHVEGAQAL